MCKLIAVLVLLLSLPFSAMAFESGSKDFYKLEMQWLMQELRFTAHKINPHFDVIGNGGSNLYHPEANTENNEQNAKNAIALVDGILIESLNFGYDFEDNKRTPTLEREYFLEMLELAKEEGAELFNLITTQTKVKNAKGRT